MLRDPNLILQHIDQRKLYQLNKKYLSSNKWEGLTLEINADIEYGNLRIYQIWNHRVNVGKEFNWKIAYDSQLTVDTLYVSSLFITNKSCMHGTSVVHNSEQKQDNIIGGTLRIFCENNLLVDENSSISMDACGIKGAIYDDKTQTAMNQLNCKCNGKNGKTGGGGGYKSMGKHGNERNGGDAYLTDELMQNDINCKRFSVGFGGGCGRYKGSKGGNGGGKIIIACNYLVINGKITANGGEGVYFGGGGSGGSILIITNKIDDDTIKKEGKITVFGGKGNKLNTKGGGDGSDGIIQFGYIDVSTNNLDFKDTIQSVHANYFIPYDTFDEQFLQKTYQRSQLLSILRGMENDGSKHLLKYISEHDNEITSKHLEYLVKDPSSIETLKLFSPQKSLSGKSIFEIIVLQCGFHEIAYCVDPYDYEMQYGDEAMQEIMYCQTTIYQQ